MIAHIAGVPVEEVALSAGPVLGMTLTLAGTRLRARWARRRRAGRGPRGPRGSVS